MGDETAELLNAAAEEAQNLIRRAFQAGYDKGVRDANERMNLAMAGLHQRPRFSAGVITADESVPQRMSPPRVGLGGDVRDKPYGSIIATMREAILTSQGVGMTTQDLLDYCKEHGVDATLNNVRETLKRLRGGEEVERRDGLIYAGPRLIGHVPAPPKSNGRAKATR